MHCALHVHCKLIPPKTCTFAPASPYNVMNMHFGEVFYEKKTAQKKPVGTYLCLSGHWYRSCVHISHRMDARNTGAGAYRRGVNAYEVLMGGHADEGSCY